MAAYQKNITDRLDDLEKENLQLRMWKVDVIKELTKIDDLRDEFNQKVDLLKSENQDMRDKFTQEIETIKDENTKLRKEKDMLMKNFADLKTFVTNSLPTTTSSYALAPSSLPSEASLSPPIFTLSSRFLVASSASASAPSSSTPKLQQNKTLQEVKNYLNIHNPDGWTLRDNEICFEMFVGGETLSCGQSEWRLTNYKVLVGEKLRSRGWVFDGVSGSMSVQTVHLFSCWLEVSQRGSGTIGWYLCTDMKPLGVHNGGSFNLMESVDKGQMFGHKMMTTGQCHHTKHSRVFQCIYTIGARVWVEAWRTSGDAIIGECRWYGAY